MPRYRSKQQGYTLIELMVALLIALFLLAGLVTLEQGMRRTYGNQGDLAQLQDKERFALTVINQIIQEAGFFPNPLTGTATSSFPSTAAFPTAGTAIFGVRSGAVPHDTISIRFNTGPSDTPSGGGGFVNSVNMDCLGLTNTTGILATSNNIFRVSGGAASALQCSNNGGNSYTTLVDGVTDMEVLYGVKTQPGTTNNIDSYMLASDVTKGPFWANVTSVKIRLTFVNPLAVPAGQTQPVSTIPGQRQFITITRIVDLMQRAAINT